MRTKVLNERGETTYAVVFETGEEVVSGLTRFAERQNLTASRITAIGAFSDAVLGYFDWDTKDYQRIPVREQVEVVSLIGDVALDGTHPKVHAHVVL
ncbi:MAG: PPC domain-containing DNA-binding protein, partial [Burkholderiales bacterium]